MSSSEIITRKGQSALVSEIIIFLRLLVWITCFSFEDIVRKKTYWYFLPFGRFRLCVHAFLDTFHGTFIVDIKFHRDATPLCFCLQSVVYLLSQSIWLLLIVVNQFVCKLIMQSKTASGISLDNFRGDRQVSFQLQVFPCSCFLTFCFCSKADFPL